MKKLLAAVLILAIGIGIVFLHDSYNKLPVVAQTAEGALILFIEGDVKLPGIGASLTPVMLITASFSVLDCESDAMNVMLYIPN